MLLLGNESQTVGPENAPMEVHRILLGAGIVLLEGTMENTNQTIDSRGLDWDNLNQLKQNNAPKMTVNDAEYTVIKLLGKGKGGYSYLVTDGRAQYVLKQIHHEPCEYYTFGDKLQFELRDYETLRNLGIPMRRNALLH